MAKKIVNGNNTKSFNRGRVTNRRVVSHVNKSTGEISYIEKSSSFNLFGLIIVILLASCVAIYLSNGSVEPKTFAGFLNTMQNVPSIDITFLRTFTELVTDLPVWLDWFEPVWGTLMSLLSIVAFVVTGLVQAMFFITYVLTYLLF